MKILAHRGYWLSPEEKNSRKALVRAFEYGLGIETDIRDLDGVLVVSHDMPRKHTSLTLAQLLDDYTVANCDSMLALNIKSDGLAKSLQQLLEKYNVRHYFCFDMSVPDSMNYFRSGMPAAARISEYEPEGYLSNKASFLWIDGFNEEQVNLVHLQDWLSRGKIVCLVSPELHGREKSSLWELLKQMPEKIIGHPNLMLCTDTPLEARRVFTS